MGEWQRQKVIREISFSSATLSARRWHTAADLGYSLMSQHAHAGKLVHVIITWMRLRVSTLITQALAHRCHPGLVMCAPARSRGQAGAHKLLLACFSVWENCETKTRESICGHVARLSVTQALAHCTLGSSSVPQHAHGGKLVHLIVTWMRPGAGTLLPPWALH